MIDRLDLMPVSQAIEFRAIHDGPNALLTIAFESQWSRFVELDDPNGAGGGAVWEGDVGDFDLREVAPSLADLIDAVATAMEMGIARPLRGGRVPHPPMGRRGLGSTEGRTLAGTCAWSAPMTTRWPPRWLEIQGLDPGDARPARRHDDDRRAPRARQRLDGHRDDQRDDQGAVRVRRGQRRPARRRHWPAVRLRSTGRRPVPAPPERHAPRARRASVRRRRGRRVVVRSIGVRGGRDGCSARGPLAARLDRALEDCRQGSFASTALPWSLNACSDGGCAPPAEMSLNPTKWCP